MDNPEKFTEHLGKRRLTSLDLLSLAMLLVALLVAIKFNVF